MLTYTEAIAQILSQVVPLKAVPTPLADALGLTLAEDLTTSFDLPPFANSSMDGFAVRAADITQVPTVLAVQGDVAAGMLSIPKLTPGMALRIMTGAPIPDGANAVIPVEETEPRPGGIAFLEAVSPGQCIRPAGEDVAAGALVVPQGTRLRPAEIGMAAMLGRPDIMAYPRPRVAIVSTGDELIAPGRPLQPGQIYNSNAFALAAQVTESGGVITQQLQARDTPESLREAFNACAGADVLITSGGVSVGDYDYVKAVFAERGTVDFWRVAIRPGKPLAVGRWADTLFFGLPGNPVSSMVTFELFVRPALRALGGHREVTRPTVKAQLTEDAEHTPGRQSFQRAIVTRSGLGYEVRPTGPQGSGMLRSMVLANALLVLPSDIALLPTGCDADVLLLD